MSNSVLTRQTQHPNYRDDNGTLCIVRCFSEKCLKTSKHGRENYALAVASGMCAWCGWKEEKENEVLQTQKS